MSNSFTPSDKLVKVEMLCTNSSKYILLKGSHPNRQNFSNTFTPSGNLVKVEMLACTNSCKYIFL